MCPVVRAWQSKASFRVAVVSKVVPGKAPQRVGLGPACPLTRGAYGALEQSLRDFSRVRLMSTLVPVRLSSWLGLAVNCGEVAAVTRVTHSGSCSLRTKGCFLEVGSFVSHGKMEAREIKRPPKPQG